MILSLLILFSCKKDTDEILIKSSYLILGDYNNTYVKVYNDTLLNSYYSSDGDYNIDLDDDGLFDIQFVTSTLGSQNTGTVSNGVSINCLHDNIQILTLQSTDTTFLHKDTVIWSSSDPNNVQVHINYISTCTRKSSTDLTDNVKNNLNVQFLEKEDTISINDNNFNTSNFNFRNSSFTSTPEFIETTNDTSFYKRTQQISCSTYYFPEETYIGIKFKNDNRLGWIKLSGSISKSVIFESAVQK